MEDDVKNNDYAARFLAVMEAQYAALGTAIASVRAVLNMNALGGSGLGGESATVPSGGVAPAIGSAIPLPRGAFLGKSIADAIRIYLNAVKARKGNREIAIALKEGGAVSTGNFDNRINGALFQLKNRGEVLRFDDGWGLAEWYPESFKTRVAEKAANGGRKKKLKRKPKATKPADAPNPVSTEPKKHTQADIELIFEKSSGRDIATADLAVQLSMRIQAVNLVCAKLAHQGKIEKVSKGIYRLAKAQPMPKAS